MNRLLEGGLYSHIIEGGEDLVIECFYRHPLNGQLASSPMHVDVVIKDVSGQPKVTDLDRLVIGHHHIPGGQIAMDIALLGQVLLREESRSLSWKMKSRRKLQAGLSSRLG